MCVFPYLNTWNTIGGDVRSNNFKDTNVMWSLNCGKVQMTIWKNPNAMMINLATRITNRSPLLCSAPGGINVLTLHIAGDHITIMIYTKNIQHNFIQKIVLFQYISIFSSLHETLKCINGCAACMATKFTNINFKYMFGERIEIPIQLCDQYLKNAKGSKRCRMHWLKRPSSPRVKVTTAAQILHALKWLLCHIFQHPDPTTAVTTTASMADTPRGELFFIELEIGYNYCVLRK